MVEHVLDESEKIEHALATFKRKVLRSGVLRELRKRRHYVKPGEARAMKTKQAIQRRRRAGRMPRDFF